MLAIERRNEILEKLQAEKRVVVSELSQQYQVSEETIRRDLEKLEHDGYAIKSYGGAVINENVTIDLPFNLRKKRNVTGKLKIAALVHDLVHDGATLMLDASSTAVFIAKELKDRKNLTIITNSIEIIMELFDVPDWNVISTGGIAKAGTFSLVGPQTDRMLHTYHVDLAVISCKGFDLRYGISDSDELHAQNKRTMLSCGSCKVVAVDHTKFDQMAFAQIAGVSELGMVITDQRPTEEWISALDENGVKCVWPE